MKSKDIYSLLLTLSILIMIIAIAVYTMIIFPIKEKIVFRQEKINKMEETLYGKLNRNWSLDSKSLNNIQRQYLDIQQGDMKRLDKILDKAFNEFKPLVDPYDNGINVDQWSRGVLYFDFADKVGALRERYASRGIYYQNEDFIDSRKEGDVDLNYVYRLLVRVHLVEKIIKLSQFNGLQLMPDPDVEDARTASQKPIRVLPVMAYSTDMEPERAFIEEFPVEFTVKGEAHKVMNLLNSMVNNDNFIPLERFMIRVLGENEYRNGGFRPTTVVEARLRCSGFLLMENPEEFKKRQEKVARLNRSKRRLGL
ncbi:MAG: hypothetical protein MK193_02945 [Lentisphaeria bacterium]|nr:hypothetical protein [Lentisphaeria bacterium]